MNEGLLIRSLGRRSVVGVAGLAGLGVVTAAAFGSFKPDNSLRTETPSPTSASITPAPTSTSIAAVAAPNTQPPPRAVVVDPAIEKARYDQAAAAAYAYLEANRVAQTGLVKATEHYDHVTTWDIGSLILGVYSAGELGLAPRSETQAWLARILETLNKVPLFDGAAYNKAYSATSGTMIGPNDTPSGVGKGWSSTDLGRLLMAFKTVERAYPELADRARAAAGRIDFSRIVKSGYLHGEEPRRSGIISYPEGRVLYEQYAAMGFDLWGHRAAAALDPATNGAPVEVMGQRLLGDKRGGETLTSEPFVLMGMEVGWTPDVREMASMLLAAQESRYKSTGQVTIASEDALQVPPHYFYYYSVLADGKPFVVRAQGPMQGDGPRWVSAKAAYGWHALLPSAYTWLAVETVEPARSSAGWASGVFEGTGRTTGIRNVNTAAVILEAVLYRERGRPFLEGGSEGSE